MTELTEDSLKDLKDQALAELESLPLEEWRVKYIGRKGLVPDLLRQLKDLPDDSKKKIGPLANELRQELEEEFTEAEKEVKGKEQGIDSNKSNPKSQIPYSLTGHLHPSTLARRRIQEIMASLGFLVVDGPEIEEEKYDFDYLNIPFEHPTRSESDTFYVEPKSDKGQGLVLRTSTSAVQVRTVLEQNLTPPFAVTSLGRVFRNEKPDPTHESTFHQVEALMVGANVTIADYKAISEALFSTFFGTDVKIRLRPGYFPFVEPGFEVDMSCSFCDANEKNCRACKGSKWIEMGGAGMVHPNVLKNMNIDSNKWQGFAWGYGFDRFAMLFHEITDLRLLWSGDIRFLKQFS